MKKTLKITIVLLLLLSICIWGFCLHEKNVLEKQYNMGMQDTKEAYLSFSKLTQSLLEDKDVDFKTFSDSYTSMIVNMSHWTSIFSELAGDGKVSYHNTNLITVTDMSIKIKALYYEIVNIKYLHGESQYTNLELLKMYEEINDEMNVILAKSI